LIEKYLKNSLATSIFHEKNKMCQVMNWSSKIKDSDSDDEEGEEEAESDEYEVT
jgi:hypothetical protein